jgi:hypothetical protein
VHAALVTWLSHQIEGGQDADVDALAAVLMGAISHYWVLADVFGGRHPLGVGEDRYLRALTSLAVAAAARSEPPAEPTDA